MNILAVDSANVNLSITLKQELHITSKTYDNDSHASEILLIEVDKIFRKSQIKPTELSYILFNKGPASFTGTRVAASVLQAIGYSKNIPVYGLSSLQVMAFKFCKQYGVKEFECIKYAYGNMCFIASFQSESGYDTDNKIRLIALDELKISDDRDVLLDRLAYNNMLKSNLKIPKKYHILDKDTTSEDLINFAEENITIGEGFNLEDTLPDYADHEI